LEKDMDSKITRNGTDRLEAFKNWLKSEITVPVPVWVLLTGGVSVVALLLVALD